MREIQTTTKIFKFQELERSAKDRAITSYNTLEYFDPRGDYDRECWIDMSAHCIKKYDIGYWDTNPIDCRLSELEIDTDLFIAQNSDSIRDQRNLYRLLRSDYSSYTADLSYILGIVNNGKHFRRDYLLECESDLRTPERTKRVNKLIVKYQNKITDHIRDIEHKIGRAINSEVENLCSIEYFQDLCDANDYEFTEEGDLI